MEVAETSQRVLPNRGAIIKRAFAVESGRRLQFSLHSSNGQKIPFGAQAYAEDGSVLGGVDYVSKRLVFGVKDKGDFTVKWDKGSCSVNYELPPVNKDLMYEMFDVTCEGK